MPMPSSTLPIQVNLAGSKRAAALPMTGSNTRYGRRSPSPCRPSARHCRASWRRTFRSRPPRSAPRRWDCPGYGGSGAWPARGNRYRSQFRFRGRRRRRTSFPDRSPRHRRPRPHGRKDLTRQRQPRSLLGSPCTSWRQLRLRTGMHRSRACPANRLPRAQPTTKSCAWNRSRSSSLPADSRPNTPTLPGGTFDFAAGLSFGQSRMEIAMTYQDRDPPADYDARRTQTKDRTLAADDAPAGSMELRSRGRRRFCPGHRVLRYQCADHPQTATVRPRNIGQ